MAKGIAYDKPNTMQLLSKYYKMGMSTTKACRYAGIDPSTVNRWLQDDPDLALQVGVWRSEVGLVARENIVKRIQGKEIIVVHEEFSPDKKRVIARTLKEVDAPPDIALSSWWLKTKENEDGEFTETQRNETVALTYEQILARQEENLKKANEIEAQQEPKPGLYGIIDKTQS